MIYVCVERRVCYMHVKKTKYVVEVRLMFGNQNGRELN